MNNGQPANHVAWAPSPAHPLDCFRELIGAAEDSGWDNDERSAILRAAQDAYAVLNKPDRVGPTERLFNLLAIMPPPAAQPARSIGSVTEGAAMDALLTLRRIYDYNEQTILLHEAPHVELRRLIEGQPQLAAVIRMLDAMMVLARSGS